jgi:phosphoribosyl 1,2-cyclic phosphodiesterase
VLAVSRIVQVRFLGTGPAGGRPGRGRSHRSESSIAVIADDATILVDATRDFTEQAHALSRIDLVVLTHPHRDAAGGVPRLACWLDRSVPLWSALATIRTLRARHRRLAPLELSAIHRARSWRGFELRPLVVPHSRDVTTLAWRIEHAGRALVYASDVARLTTRLAALCAGCELLVLDGATWRRRIFSHLEIRSTVQAIARWPVGRVLFTQLGRSTPPHAELDAWLRARDPRFGAAYDGLVVDV